MELEYKNIEQKVYERIINTESPTKELQEIHTRNLIDCSAGDITAKKYVKTLIKNILTDITKKAEESTIDKIYAKYWGLGPMEKYDTPEIDEIMTFGKRITIIKSGQVIDVEEEFESEEEIMSIMRRCLEFNKGADLNESNAIVYARRKDGSRITVVIPPVAKFPYLNIRKFDSFQPTTENMLKTETISKQESELFNVLVRGRANIMVIGEMGCGKTTFMKWLIHFMPKDKIVETIETTFELNLDKLYPEMHCRQLEERLPLYEMSELFVATLRQTADIIIVGECRSYEVNELINAMSRGHSGSIGTAHCLSPLGMIDDFADMVLESGKTADLKLLKYRIGRSIDIVVRFRKMPNKNKVCAGIYELITNDKTLETEANTIYEYTIDEENPYKKGKHEKKGNLSENLKKKLISYGMSKSKIRKAEGD